jgi:hypothetical protein
MQDARVAVEEQDDPGDSLPRKVLGTAPEIYFRGPSLTRVAQLEELSRPKPERTRDQIGGKLCDLRIEVANHCVVIPPSVLDVLLDLGETPLEREEALRRLEIGICLRQREDLPYRGRQRALGLAGGGRTSGARCAIPRVGIRSCRRLSWTSMSAQALEASRRRRARLL